MSWGNKLLFKIIYYIVLYAANRLLAKDKDYPLVAAVEFMKYDSCARKWRGNLDFRRVPVLGGSRYNKSRTRVRYGTLCTLVEKFN